jgi:phospholipid/cholesterol/gamma-HCH transport system ATP-binding protein
LYFQPDFLHVRKTVSDLLLEIKNVSLGYGEEIVLGGVDLCVRRGELTVVAGPSGCGKSTLLKAAVGLLAPVSGSVRLFGVDLAGISEDRLSGLRSRVGLLFQGGALINSMTVAENVALPLNQFSRLPENVIDTLVRMKLGQVGLEKAYAKTPPELSGGMRKRAALARSLALDPELLICDEPSAGLDPVTAAGLDQLLLDLRSALNMTLLVVTHELGSIDAIADRVVVIDNGGLIFDGPLAQARRSDIPAVRDFFTRQPPRAEDRGKSMLERFLKTTGEVAS